MPLFEGDASVLPSDLPPSGLTVSVLGSTVLLSAAGSFLALFLSSADIVFPDALICMLPPRPHGATWRRRFHYASPPCVYSQIYPGPRHQTSPTSRRTLWRSRRCSVQPIANKIMAMKNTANTTPSSRAAKLPSAP